MVDNNHVKISENLCYVDFLLNHIADHYNFPVEELFNEVHRSNMSKLHDGVVVKNELGKVVKSPNYSPADIEGILRKQGLLK
jgi:predicted HAD superfamily Cof-like phosphohydrolase